MSLSSAHRCSSKNAILLSETLKTSGTDKSKLQNVEMNGPNDQQCSKDLYALNPRGSGGGHEMFANRPSPARLNT